MLFRPKGAYLIVYHYLADVRQWWLYPFLQILCSSGAKTLRIQCPKLSPFFGGTGRGFLKSLYSEQTVRLIGIEGINSFSTFHITDYPNGDGQNQNFINGFQHSLSENHGD